MRDEAGKERVGDRETRTWRRGAETALDSFCDLLEKIETKEAVGIT